MPEAGTSACRSAPTRIRRTSARPRRTSSSRRAPCATTSRGRYRATPRCFSPPADALPSRPFGFLETLMRSLRLVPVFCLSALVAAVATPALALKYAAPEHRLKVDPAILVWKPGEVASEPEEALNLVGADVMDEITLGWVKLFRKAYPKLSVTMEARASGTGGPALTEARAHLAPVGRELLPPEEKAFVDKFGYKPFAIRVATGSV